MNPQHIWARTATGSYGEVRKTNNFIITIFKETCSKNFSLVILLSTSQDFEKIYITKNNSEKLVAFSWALRVQLYTGSLEIANTYIQLFHTFPKYIDTPTLLTTKSEKIKTIPS